MRKRFLILLMALVTAACTGRIAIPQTGVPARPVVSANQVAPTPNQPSVEPTLPSQDPNLPSVETNQPSAAPSQTGSGLTLYLPTINNGNSRAELGADWPMTAANPQRTSWVSDEVTGNLNVEWYLPIEAYIPQNVQIIAVDGLLYVSTARGLVVINADNGQVAWRFNTAMPLGNSPTVSNGVVYVGGYDRKLYALNAYTGQFLWAFEGAKAGYDTNPLVVDGKVILGNRDGAMYAIGANGTPNQGQQIWKYQTGAAIHFSAAYQGGVVFFASDDNYAYGLRADSGSLVWKSSKLPGDGFHSYWPVIYRNKVIFPAAVSYRPDMTPGSRSVDSTNKDIRAIWPEQTEGMIVGPQVADQAWANGFPVMDANRLTEYYENSPASPSNPYIHKPWRRAFIVLDQSSGTEFTFDSDGDGYEEYMPVFWWQTGSGNLYPGIVGADDILYHNNAFRCCSDPKGKVLGWNIDTPGLLASTGSRSYGVPSGGFAAMAEPQAISGAGNIIYRSLCCDRVGDWFSTEMPARNGGLWSYDLGERAPGYDNLWFFYPESISRLWAWYQGGADFYQDSGTDPHNYNSVNGIYASHGVQNPIIPHNGRLYVHRGNSVIAFGPGATTNPLPMVPIEAASAQPAPLSLNDLTNRLQVEVQKIVDAGHLRPGYYVIGQHNDYGHLASYFDNPGDTLYTLSIAYPYLSAGLQTQVKSYLSREFQDYFDSEMFVTIGWLDGAAREAMPLPDDVAANLVSNPIPPSANIGPRFSWSYPPFNFYAMYKYAQLIPEVNKGRVYDLAKTKINALLQDSQAVPTDYFREKPYEHNAYLSGYIGFLNLQNQAGMSQQDAGLRDQVTNELNRLLSLKYSIFDKDSYWIENPGVVPNNPSQTNLYQRKEMDIARNFMWLTPELGNYLNQNLNAQVQQAVNEYNYVAPYWFVARYETFPGEGSSSVLWNYPAVFQAKAFILKESRPALTGYLDVPAFLRGDLFYLQNLIAAIEAAP